MAPSYTERKESLLCGVCYLVILCSVVRRTLANSRHISSTSINPYVLIHRPTVRVRKRGGCTRPRETHPVLRARADADLDALRPKLIVEVAVPQSGCPEPLLGCAMRATRESGERVWSRSSVGGEAVDAHCSGSTPTSRHIRLN